MLICTCTVDPTVVVFLGMPYTGVKGEFEVVGFTTLTYVLVLVGTYGALVLLILGGHATKARCEGTHCNINEQHLKQPTFFQLTTSKTTLGVPCRLRILHSGIGSLLLGECGHTKLVPASCRLQQLRAHDGQPF